MTLHFPSKIRALHIYLLAIIGVGTYLRLYDSNNLGFGWDDVGHVMLRSNPERNLSAIIIDSYRDAHPALRNIILHCITWITMDPFWLRAVSWVPGIALLMLIYIWLRNLFDSRAHGAIGITLVALGYKFLVLSMSTRPYLLFACFMVGYLICWQRYLQENQKKWLVLMVLCGALSACTHYGAVLYLIPASLVGIVTLYAHDTSNIRRIVRFGFFNAVPFLLLCIQYLLINHLNSGYSDRLVKSARFRTNIDGVSEITSILVRGMDTFTFESELFPSAVFLFWAVGLLLFLLHRRLALFFLCLLVLGNNLVLHLFGLYPYVASRHFLPLFIVSLAPISYAFYFLLTLFDTRRYATVWKVCILTMTAGFIFSSPMFHRPISVYILEEHRRPYFYSGRDTYQMPEYIKQHARSGDMVLVSRELIQLLNLKQVDTNAWFADLPQTCELPVNLANGFLPRLGKYEGQKKQALQNFVRKECSAGEETRFWCPYCESPKGIAQLQPVVFLDYNPLNLFDLHAQKKG